MKGGAHMYNETLNFGTVRFPDIAFLRFNVKGIQADSMQFTLPLCMLQKGAHVSVHERPAMVV